MALLVDCDRLDELRIFTHYAGVLGSGLHNIGEAIVLAWAEVHCGTAVVDERAGAREGKARGVDVHGTVWLIVEGYRSSQLDRQQAANLVDDLRASQMWLPCSGADLLDYARQEGLLD